ncbi:MAG: fibronectin type III domain-containing protein [Gaiellales bacterium]
MHVVRPAAVLVVAAFMALGLAAPASAQEICANAGLSTAGTATLASFPTGSGTAASLDVAGAQLRQPAIRADSAPAYVPDAAGARLLVVAAGPLTQNATIPLPAGSGPTKVVLSPTRARAYVLNAANRTISIVDTAERRVVGTSGELDGTSPLVDIALSPDGATLYALTAAPVPVRLHLIDASADATTPAPPVTLNALAAAHALAVTASRVVVAITTAGGDDTLLTRDRAGAPIAAGTTDLGATPTALAVSADGVTAYVATAAPALIPVPIATLVPGTAATPAGQVGAIAIGPSGAVYAAETSAIGIYSAAGARTGAVSGAAGTAVAICPSTAVIPGAPGAVAGTRGDRSVNVTWTPPASDGGSPVASYLVTAAPGGATCTATGATTCTVEGLANGTRYTFTVQARNAVGLGPASARSKPVTPRRDTSARQLAATPVTWRTTRRLVTFAVTVSADQAGVLAMAVVHRKRVYCSNGRRVTAPGTYRIQCRMRGRGRTLVRARRTTFTVRVVLTPTLGTLSRSVQEAVVARRR